MKKNLMVWSMVLGCSTAQASQDWSKEELLQACTGLAKSLTVFANKVADSVQEPDAESPIPESATKSGAAWFGPAQFTEIVRQMSVVPLGVPQRIALANPTPGMPDSGQISRATYVKGGGFSYGVQGFTLEPATVGIYQLLGSVIPAPALGERPTGFVWTNGQQELIKLADGWYSTVPIAALPQAPQAIVPPGTPLALNGSTLFLIGAAPGYDALYGNIRNVGQGTPVGESIQVGGVIYYKWVVKSTDHHFYYAWSRVPSGINAV